MQSHREALNDSDAKVLAVCVDPFAENLKIVDRLKLDFPILSDPELKVISRYGLVHEKGNPMDGSDIARPGVFILDRDGVVQWRNLTDNWRVRVRPETIIEQLALIP